MELDPYMYKRTPALIAICYSRNIMCVGMYGTIDDFSLKPSSIA